MQRYKSLGQSLGLKPQSICVYLCVIVAKRKGRNGKETYGYKEPLFVLKKKVEVPPRLNARKILYGVLRRRMPRLRGAIFQILAPSEMLKGGK